ncbi:hypothetical protein PLEOSDRAFT_162344 [Pleurotus ostreatus PC15]|uniref:Transmembrane protein n=1 Tax=Pleurotus ostreatus (strain PC15) TaxID=1137138 RepID=A0A067N9L0_PLEO1|nr:hypothetical protein PLEOSDRAFT_162344 [Pleurotus ostreatus PC15]
MSESSLSPSSTTSFPPTSASVSATTTDPPFFIDPATMSPLPNSNGRDVDMALVKTVLAWLFPIIGIITTVVIVMWMCAHKSALDSSLVLTTPSPIQFFARKRTDSTIPTSRVRRVPRTTALAQLNVDDNGYYPYVVPPALVYAQRSRRVRTRGADVDAYGRRTDGGGDHDDLGDKDELPAYEHAGGPPNYVDLEVGHPRAVTIRSECAPSYQPTPHHLQQHAPPAVQSTPGAPPNPDEYPPPPSLHDPQNDPAR